MENTIPINADVQYYYFILNSQNCPLGCLSWLLQMKPYLALMRNFPENIFLCAKGHLIQLYDQKEEGTRVK